MQDQENAIPTIRKQTPWNKGKLTGAKPPLRPKHVWSIRTKLQIEGRVGDLAMLAGHRPQDPFGCLFQSGSNYGYWVDGRPFS